MDEQDKRQRELSRFLDALEWGLDNIEHIGDETVRSCLKMIEAKIKKTGAEEERPSAQRKLVAASEAVA